MTLIWSINYIVAKIVLRSFPALLVGPLRAAFAAALLAPVYGIARWRSKEKDSWEWRELATLAILGVFGITLNQVFFVLGMNRTSVAHAALVIATTPLQVMLLASLRGQEHVTPRKLGGMLTAVAGIVVLNFGPGRDLHGASMLGDMFVFLAAFSFSVYTVFGKEVARRHDSLTANSLGYFAGGLAGAPLLWQQSMGFDYGKVPASGWLALSYMAVLSSVLCYFIFYYALNHLPASRVAAFSYMQPVIAAGAGWAILGEPVTASVGMGGLMVLSGVWLTGRG